jgi:crossover junction endodeoxyribonuclease RuvC
LAKPRTITLGIDPGLQVTGYGLIQSTADGTTMLEAGVLRTTISDTDSPDDQLARRLAELHKGLSEILDEFSPQAIAIEQLYAHYDHPRTAILMGHARGVLMLAGATRSIDIVSYASTTVKKIVTGHGRATKEQMQHAVTRELNLPAIPEPHDAADALAIALCHVYTASARHGRSNARYTGVNRTMLDS